MVAATYDEALRRLLIHEGGYSNHPSDPGGPTNFGITIHDYRKYVKPDADAADVRAMRLDEAKAIYRTKYWNAQRCDALPAGVDYAVFDYGVNSGVGRSAKVLQRVLGLSDDGRVTDAVIAAANRCDAKGLIVGICDERLAFLKRLKTWPVFGAGWGRRVAEVRSVALAMAGGSLASSNTKSSAPGKGAVPVNKKAQQGTAGGVATAGAGAAQQAHQSGARPIVIVAVVLVTIALAVAGWWWWRRRQRLQQEG